MQMLQHHRNMYRSIIDKQRRQVQRMQVQQYEITSHMDGLGIDTILAIPEQKPIGIVQLVHGMAEHKERYLSLMEYLCDQGYVCVIHDHRGHGGSIRSKEDYGYFYADGKEAIVEDVHQVTQWVKKRYPELPNYLFGHSMGSLIARCYVKKYDNEINGLIVCGSPSNNVLAGLAILLCKIMIKIKDDHARGDLFQKIAFGAYNRGFNPEFSPNDWISENRENVKDYDADEKCGFIFTLNGFLNLFLLVKETYSKKGWNLKNPSLPVFFLSGAKDPCMNTREAFEDAVRFMRQMGYRNTKAKLYPDMRHEIFHEDDKEQVYKDIVTLLKRWE